MTDEQIVALAHYLCDAGTWELGDYEYDYYSQAERYWVPSRESFIKLIKEFCDKAGV